MKDHEPRDGKEHQRLAIETHEAAEERRAEIFEEYGIRYTELARLRYFDVVRMLVINPTHCSLLGTSLSTDTHLLLTQAIFIYAS